jgi:hypothetical protein
MTQDDLIARIVERFPDLVTVDVPRQRAAEEARRGSMALVIAAGVGGKLDPSAAATLSHAAVDQAKAYLERTADEHVRDGLAHHVFNVLRGSRDDVDGAKYADVLIALAGMGVA